MFTTENSKGNQHAKGNPPNRTSFDGTQVLDKSPSWKGGIYYTKRDGWQITYAPKKRMSLARYNYIQAHNNIPKRHIIYHINGNIHDNDISNLVCIPRSELIKLNKKLI